MKHIELLEKLGACGVAIKWAKNYESLEHAWNESKRPDWMMWLDDKMDLFTDKERRLLACRFVRETPIGDGKTVWDLLKDERSRNAVNVVEKFANGEATEEELSAARDAAWDARDAAWDATGVVAGDAAWAARTAAWAARTAAWAAAGDAAWAAAGDAAWAAAGDAAWAAAGDARVTVWDSQSEIIRSYGNPFDGNIVKSCKSA